MWVGTRELRRAFISFSAAVSSTGVRQLKNLRRQLKT